MTHDPLCICADDDYRCRHCYAPDCSCDCVAIRRVRPLITNAALDAARDAVAALLDEFPNPDFQIANSAVHTALAAIDALRGES